MVKRILSLILAICMVAGVVGVVPVVVSATEYSGTCGDNVKWVLDTKTGVLTISGTGAMTNYFWDAPWVDYANDVTKVIIEDGITRIGDTAFCGFANLKIVDFGSTITSIGYYAFSRTGLETIVVPSTVTSIGTRVFGECTLLQTAEVSVLGGYMFADCPKLTSVKLGETIAEIDQYAFDNCKSLESLRIPGSVVAIGEGIANGCTSLQYVIYDGTRTQWDEISDENVGLSYYENVICTVCGDGLTSTFSEDGVLTISGNGKIYDEAFSSAIEFPEPIKKVIISDGVNEIGYQSFLGLDSVTYISIADSVEVIDKNAFALSEGITEVYLPDNLEVINEETFMGCVNLTNINMPSSLKTIKRDAFTGTNLNSVEFPDSLETIEEYAFYGSNLSEVTVSKSMTSVGLDAFANCINLKKINVTDLEAFCEIVYYGQPANEFLAYGADLYVNGVLSRNLTIPNTVSKLSIAAFAGYKNLNSVVLSESLTEVNGYSFGDCTGLKTVTIPNSITKIAEYAFYNCDNLTDVYYNGTEEEWNEISMGSDNTCLTDATIHFKIPPVIVDGEEVETYGSIVLGTDNGNGTYSLPENVLGYCLDEDFVDAGMYEVDGGEVITTVKFNVTMVQGAQVRFGGGLDTNGKITTGNGLRFIAMVDRSNFDGEGYGMKLTAEGSDKETIVDAEKWQNDEVTFTVALTDMAESNYIRKFTATPFVKVKYADGAEKTIYGTETVTRSIYQVASGLLKDDEQSDYELFDVLNAYANQTGIRLVVKDGELKANTNYTKSGAYALSEDELHFAVSDAAYDSASNAYSVILTAQGNAEIITDNNFWYDYIRVNNNNSLVKDKVEVEKVEGNEKAVKVTFYADGLIERPADKNDNVTTDPGDSDYDGESEWK